MNGSQAWLEKDFYKTLGVSQTASIEEIKRAYRKLARTYHPDKNPNDRAAEDRMKEISEANDVLGDPKRRTEYDEFRKAASSGFHPGGSGGFRSEDLGDIFSQFFGGGGRRGRASRGADIESEVMLSFDDAMRGATITVNVPRTVACSNCGGSGATPGTSVTTCPQCGGSGMTGVDQGLFSFSRPCPRCGGSGRNIESPCPRCQGSGAERRTDAVRARIPAGVRDGARIRVRGRGETGAGQPGDLYVVVRVAPHQMFGRSSDDLTLTLPLTFTEAALGAEVRVPTFEGSVTLKIPAGTQNGRTFRVRGRGAPKTKGGYGDLLVSVRVEVPTHLTPAEKELLEQLKELNAASPREHLGV